jgi:hypothetical protein
MRMKKLISSTRALCSLLAVIMPVAALAQVPTMISYQGRVQVSNTNFNGQGQFKFAFVRGNTPNLLWKNDGSPGDTEPTAAVTLPVTNGLVNALLGDAALANMTAIPTSVFSQSDVRLRIWFNSGAGFQQLSPDHRIVSVGYAIVAGTVPDHSLSAAKFAPGTFHPTNFPANSITSAQLADDLDLGATNLNGRLDLYRTSAGTPGVSLIGSTSQIITYGSDGLEQIRLHGVSYGELLLRNSLPNNAVAVTLTAQGDDGGRLTLANTNGSSRALLSGENAGGALWLYQADGGIGALLDGDSSGAGFLSLRGTNGNTRASLDASDNGGAALRLYESDGTQTATITAQNNGVLTLNQGDGSLGARLTADNGSGGGGLSIYRNNGTFAAQLTVADDTTRDGFLGLANSAGVNRLYARVWNGATASAYLGMVNSSGQQTITLDADAAGNGRVTTQVLQITGGSDLSENFDIKAVIDEIRPGMLVSIDPDQPGRLITTTRAYDTTVAGVVSGAGGVKTGMLMGQQGSVADGKHPVALSGRVYCWVDADRGAIKPGDLITSSDTPGHGMKVKSHKKAAGAVIGKAMSSLDKGKGLVLVLVSLQ